MGIEKNKSFFNSLYKNLNKGNIPLKIRFGYKIRAPFYAMLESTIKTYKGRVLGVADHSVCLELGIGLDGLALILAQRGLETIAIDISDEAIKLASQKLPEGTGINLTYMCDNAEQTKFENQSFDLIYGKWILHHLDLERSLNEIKRLLRPQGKAIFLEPLGANPLIYFFRKITPWLRVKDEHPLRGKDLDKLKKMFPQHELDYYHFLFFLAPFVSGQVLERMEKWLIEKFPQLRHLCWQVLIIIKKTRC